MTYWIEFVTSLFKNAPALTEVTFTGVHNDVPVVNITASRADFASKIGNLQEEIAAHSAKTFALLGMHKISEAGAQKEQEAFKAKTYKTALSLLPSRRS